MKPKQGDIVTVEYEGRLEDGTVFDSTAKHGEPLKFDLGTKQIIPGFNKAIAQLSKGEEKEFTISAKDAYGEKNEKFEQKVPKIHMPKDQEPEAGMMLLMKTPSGQQVPVIIKKVDEDTVTLDLNHPLAGKTLIFKIKLVDIEEK